VLVFNVKSGEVEGTDVSGLTVAAVADTRSDDRRQLAARRVHRRGGFRRASREACGVFSGALGGPMESADSDRMTQPSLTSIGARSTPILADQAKHSIGPPSAPENTPPSFSACSSEAAPSMNTPSRQLPSVITFGVSATAATVRPLTRSLDLALFTLNTSTTLQRSRVAPSASDAVQGQTTSQEQVSKYDPSNFQDMRASLGERCRTILFPNREGVNRLPNDLRTRAGSVVNGERARANADLTWRRPKLVLAVVGAFAVIAVAFGHQRRAAPEGRWVHRQRLESERATALLRRSVGYDVNPGIAAHPGAGGGKLDLANQSIRSQVDRLSTALAQTKYVGHVVNPVRDQRGGQALIGRDGRSLVISADLATQDARTTGRGG